MIVLRSPKGWTCPTEIDGKTVRGLLAIAPGADGRHGQARPREDPRGVAEELPPRGAVRRDRPSASPSSRRSHPTGERRMGANPHANGGLLLKDLQLARVPGLRRRGPRAGRRRRRRPHACRGKFLAEVMKLNLAAQQLPRLQPRRERLEPLAGHLRRDQARLRRRDSADRRQPRARRPRDGDAVRAPVPGLARGLPAHRPARLLQLLRGVHPHHRLDVQPARQVAEGVQPHRRGGGRSPRSTTCSRATSGGRTTTASATRIPASSTTS